jgi:murein L,D-transpeptidase YafK
VLSVRPRPVPVVLGVAGLSALAWPFGAAGDAPCKAPEVRIYKRQGELDLVCGGAVRRTMAATFGADPVGPKEREGDERTPEGDYRISLKVKSDRFHRFLGVSYPNDEDRKRGAKKGIKKLGGGIGIHGTTKKLAGLSRVWTRFASATGLSGVWGPTDGCIGVANEDVEVLFKTVPVGARVVIRPARPVPMGPKPDGGA